MADWTDIEVNLIVADYFLMLEKELKGIPYNKSQHRKMLSPLLNGRSEGSIEFKHQNISAALIHLGQLYIKGYKPRWNYQKQLLEEKISALLLKQGPSLESTFIEFVESPTTSIPSISDFSKFIENPPEPQDISEPKIEYTRRPIKINYLQREQNNNSLGEKGEILVLEYERWRLIHEGKESLAEKVEWISKHDDGAGFDILSKNINGTDRFIEVKTTKLGKDTPIFFSKNEYEFSIAQANNYHLYRLFDFNQNPRMFNVNGSFDSFCSKEAIQYKGLWD